MFSPYQLLSDPTNLPRHPTLCFICLSLDFFLKKNTKEKWETNNSNKKHPEKWKSKQAEKRPVKQKLPKQSKMEEKVHKNTTELILCSWATVGRGTFPGAWLKFPVKLHWRRQVFSLPVITNYKYLLGEGCHTVSTFHSQCCDPIWLEPILVLNMQPQPLWFHVYTSLVTSGRHWFLRADHHLWRLTSVCLLFYTCPWALREGWMKTSHVGLSAPKSCTLHIVQLSLC